MALPGAEIAAIELKPHPPKWQTDTASKLPPKTGGVRAMVTG